MDFSRIAKQLNEGESLDAAASAAEKATQGGINAKEANRMSREKQKAGMAQQRSTVSKSDVSYASEEARSEREYAKMLNNERSDWRKDLNEALNDNAEGNHPFVDVMPSMDQKQQELKKQMKKVATGAADHDGYHEAGDGEHSVKEDKAFDLVRQQIMDKHGPGAIIDTKKPKKQVSPEERKANAERRARNYASNQRNVNPYKARPGESD